MSFRTSLFDGTKNLKFTGKETQHQSDFENASKLVRCSTKKCDKLCGKINTYLALGQDCHEKAEGKAKKLHFIFLGRKII